MRSGELVEALEYQTATSEILRVISRSLSDTKPVFDAIAQSALKLFPHSAVQIVVPEGGQVRAAAIAHADATHVEALHRTFPIPLDRAYMHATAILDRRLLDVADATAETYASAPFASGIKNFLASGYRAITIVPMMRGDAAIGAMSVARPVAGPLSAKQTALLRTFADQAVIAIENVRLFNGLRESLQQQTATADVLKVISRSTFDLQVVLDTLVESASRLCEADIVAIHREKNGGYDLVSAFGYTAEDRAFVAKDNPLPPARGSVVGRTVLEGKVVHVLDVQSDPDYTLIAFAKRVGQRTALGVPLLREGKLVGVMFLARHTVRPFTNKQIELATTFADQAVIAIENTRLLGELRQRTSDLTESLQQQTATSDVLHTISSSPGELTPVFETILANATRLCEAKFGNAYLVQNGAIQHAATYNTPSAFIEFRKHTPPSADPGTPSGRMLQTKSVVHIPDLAAEESYRERHPGVVAAVELLGERTSLHVPMLKESELKGYFSIYRQEVRPFTEQQIALVKNFADQAVIAIENARLLNELRQSLQQQTATADVLKVISRSTFDLQKVLDTLVESATRLCEADNGSLFRREGEDYLWAASYGYPDAYLDYVKGRRVPADRGSATGRTALVQNIVHIPDVLQDSEYTFWGAQKSGNFRAILSVPLMREGVPIGVFGLTRSKPGPFTERQVELVTTFADQAVIAIENARLFEEVEARNRDLTALGEVGRAVSSTLDLKVVLKTIVDHAVALSGADASLIFYFRMDTGRFDLGETAGLDDQSIERYRTLDIGESETGLGEAITSRQPVQAPDIAKRPSNPLRNAALEAGMRAALVVPLLGAEGPLGALVLQRRTPGEFSPVVISLMRSFADQSAIALENARLFDEAAQKSRELEIASEHKSRFVANMSHELRTPLAAMLGYAELMEEGIYEPLGEQSLAALGRVRSNGKHLLGLINTILDIAKIESGQFTLNMTEYSIAGVVEAVRAATELLAQNKRLALTTEVAGSLPLGIGDEQRLTQVLLNLVGNAIKFTDRGEVRVRAEAADGRFAGSVVDTGPGIPEHERTRIFEQFHQIDELEHEGQRGDRPRPRHCQTDRRDAWRPHLGRLEGRRGIDVPDGIAHTHRKLIA